MKKGVSYPFKEDIRTPCERADKIKIGEAGAKIKCDRAVKAPTRAAAEAVARADPCRRGAGGGKAYNFSVSARPRDPRENESCEKSHPMLSDAMSSWTTQSFSPNPRAKSK